MPQIELPPTEERFVATENFDDQSLSLRDECAVSARPNVIAYRKACQPSGVGLSHYVLLTSAK